MRLVTQTAKEKKGVVSAASQKNKAYTRIQVDVISLWKYGD